MGKKDRQADTCTESWEEWSGLSPGETSASRNRVGQKQSSVYVHSRTKKRGHYMQINKKAGVAHLSRSSLYRERVFRL